MQRSDTPIDEHLASIDPRFRDDVITLHEELAALFVDSEPVLYEGKFWGGSDQAIIGYHPYTYRRSDGTQVQWFVVGLGAQKNYISLYVSAVVDGEYLSKRDGPDLGNVKVGSSSVSFKSLDDVDRPKLTAFLQTARSA